MTFREVVSATGLTLDGRAGPRNTSAKEPFLRLNSRPSHHRSLQNRNFLSLLRVKGVVVVDIHYLPAARLKGPTD
jgi:hypothetical protein